MKVLVRDKNPGERGHDNVIRTEGGVQRPSARSLTVCVRESALWVGHAGN